MKVSKLCRTLRTVRYLRPSQIAVRLSRLIRSRLGIRRPAVFAGTPQTRGQQPALPEFSHPCARGGTLIESLEQGQLPLLSQSLDLELKAGGIDWKLGDVSEGRLAAITLHYHQWLYELAKVASSDGLMADRARSLFEHHLDDWLERCDLCQPGADSLAWNSYAIATRFGWSVRAWQTLLKSEVPLSPTLRDRWLNSLYRQAEHLSANLEWDLRANHLLRDAVGLAWAGRFFEGDQASGWLRAATKLAVTQAHEQMLADGAHFERSPFYHLEVMDDWLTLSVLLQDDHVRNMMREIWQQAAEYISWIRHPDGCVAQLNDGAAAVAETHLCCGETLGLSFSRVLPCGGRLFPDSGMVVWHGDRWSLFFDVGDVGPEYQPGHAHADSLTVECSFGGRRLFVDPGCHSYDLNDRRKYDRSTDAHNTVCIDEMDSSEVWHIFRVGRRARVSEVDARFSPDGVECSALHDGYRFLSGRPAHRRSVHVDEGNCFLRIVDSIEGAGTHSVSGGFLLDPGWQVEAIGCGWLLRSHPEVLAVRISGPAGLHLTLEDRPVHPDYGVELPSTRLCWRYYGTLPLEVETEVSTHIAENSAD